MDTTGGADSRSLEPKPDVLVLIPFHFAQLSIFLTEMPHC